MGYLSFREGRPSPCLSISCETIVMTQASRLLGFSDDWVQRVLGDSKCAMVKSRVLLGMVVFPPLIWNPYNWYIKPYWVDDHPLLYGNNGSLDPSSNDHGSKPTHDIPLNPGWLMGILILVYYNPYITG